MDDRVLTAFIVVPQVGAQQRHVVDEETLYELVGKHADKKQDDREAVQRVLQRSEVRQVASRLGLNLDKTVKHVAALEDRELTRLAVEARKLESELAGGQGVPMRGSMRVWAAVIIFVIALVLILVLTGD